MTKIINIEEHKSKKRNSEAGTLSDGTEVIFETIPRSELTKESKDFQDLLGGIPIYRMNLLNAPKKGA